MGHPVKGVSGMPSPRPGSGVGSAPVSGTAPSSGTVPSGAGVGSAPVSGVVPPGAGVGLPSPGVK